MAGSAGRARRWCRPARHLLLSEPKQERVQGGAFSFAERREEIVVDLAGKDSEAPERSLPVRCQPDEVPPTVVRIAAALDEPLLFQLVEQPDQLAAVIAERVGDRPLGLMGALRQG